MSSEEKMPAASGRLERREERREKRRGKQVAIKYPFWFGGSASSMAACVTHPLDLGTSCCESSSYPRLSRDHTDRSP